MNLNTVYLLNTILGLFFGLGWLLLPGTISGIYSDVALPAEALVIARLLGAAYVGYSILSWFARSIADPLAQRAIVTAYALTYALGLVVILIAQFSGLFNAINWSTVAIFLLFTIAFTYFRFRIPEIA